MHTLPTKFSKGGAWEWLPAVLESSLVAFTEAHNPPVMGSLLPYRVLRGLFDSSPEEPIVGAAIGGGRDATRSLIADWLETGTSPSGAASILSGGTPEGRFEAAKDWIAAMRVSVEDQFVTGGSKPIATVRNRNDAKKLPLFRDLAPDVLWAMDRLEELFGEAMAQVGQNSGGPTVPLSGPAL